MVEMSRQRTAPACLPVNCSHHSARRPTCGRGLSRSAQILRARRSFTSAAWNRRRLPAESDGPLNGGTFITRIFLSLFCLFSARYRHRLPESSNPFLYPQSRTAARTLRRSEERRVGEEC